MIKLEFVIKIYDEHGRLKLPSKVMRLLGLEKNMLLRLIVEGDKIVIVPIRKAWPRKEDIDEDEVLAEKHLAWYEV